MMLKCNFKSITTQKSGNSIDENEDNILEPSKSEIEFETLVKFAISDGATESSFSREWSDLLVSAYKDKPFDKAHLSETVNAISFLWQSMANAIELPWYAEQKAETGAFATFLGLTINREENIFDSVAIGDCNLFQIRNDEILITFPVTTIEEFGNTPNLIASNQTYQTELEKTVTYQTGSIEPNDLIIVATDALAMWIFKQKDAGEKPWNHLTNILDKDKEDFEIWLNTQRKDNEIKNDDVTLLIVKFE
jgi:hypothetical protein